MDITREEIEKVFVLWADKYISGIDDFNVEYDDPDYGEACVEIFIELLNEIRATEVEKQ